MMRKSFSDAIYEEQTHLAEDELSEFISVVKELYGPAEAKLSIEDWLEESELMDSPPRSEVRNWRAVTIAASARLANRVKISTASANLTQRIAEQEASRAHRLLRRPPR